MSLKVMKGVSFSEERLQKWLDEDGVVHVQPKRDEIRCVVNVVLYRDTYDDTQRPYYVTFTSASGKQLYNLDVHSQTFIDLYHAFGVSTFDCGVLINDSFDVTKRVVRSSKEHYNTNGEVYEMLWDKKPTKNKAGILFYASNLTADFWLYDLPLVDKHWYCRLGIMGKIASMYDRVFLPRTVLASNSEQVHQLYDSYIEEGLEGIMIKRRNFQYKYGRSTDWQKMKPVEEKDGVIVGFTEGKGKYAGLIGSVKVDFGDGTFTFVSGMDDSTRKNISKYPQNYLGEVLRVPYMMRDSQGGYRHPRWGGLHEDKVASDVYNAPNEG
ncbi:DNA ligase [Salmonella phage vB_SpuP_Spp16]|uniref:DNA ligase n=1 Tax=Salmonella phage vB_SpuP_Spp16 TaxID=2081603 RepID=A0A2P9JZS5_9CAUD|nr:DNA ligase [Salmonella phage vB_SpuP_Spp16]AVI05040.1 DNA ligase [Salmonella phage vB_SpuP_Spp16]